MPPCGSHSAVFDGTGILRFWSECSLCEFTVKERNIEFKAVLAYEPKVAVVRGVIPHIRCQVRVVRHLLYTFARGQQWLRAMSFFKANDQFANRSPKQDSLYKINSYFAEEG